MYVLDVMDKMSGGAFKKGTREATPLERVTEWDALTPEQHTQLEEKMGPDWVMKQGAEIERLRKQVKI